MKKILKGLLPILFTAGYVISSQIIYYGVDEDVFSIKDMFQQVAGNIIIIAVLLMYARFVCTEQWEKLPERRISLKEIFIILLMIPGFHFLIDRLVILFVRYSGQMEVPIALTIRDLGEIRIFLFDALFALLIAPLMEELLFRFCLLSSYHSLAGKIYGVVCGAIIFGWMHGTKTMRISAVISGVILGIVFIVTNNIFICIVIHAGINLLVTICACVMVSVQNEQVISFVQSVIYVNPPILLISLLFSLLGVVFAVRHQAEESGCLC